MSEPPFVVDGTWFYETIGRTWFIVHWAMQDWATQNVVCLREPDTGSYNYLKWSRKSQTWQPAKMNDNGVFYIVKAKYGEFIYKGDDGPGDARFRFCSAAKEERDYAELLQYATDNGK
jgi:hypothetical protein